MMYTYGAHEKPGRIKFASSIMLEKGRKFEEQHLRYKLQKWKKTGDFDILNNINEHIKLLQLMD